MSDQLPEIPEIPQKYLNDSKDPSLSSGERIRAENYFRTWFGLFHFLYPNHRVVDFIHS
jgi:hypothetical protein